jgi:hypothetical protein
LVFVKTISYNLNQSASFIEAIFVLQRMALHHALQNKKGFSPSTIVVIHKLKQGNTL